MLYACCKTLVDQVTDGSCTDGSPAMFPAVITSSMICTSPDKSSTSVELAGVPLVSCTKTFPGLFSTTASITISPTTCPSLLYAAAVASASPAPN